MGHSFLDPGPAQAAKHLIKAIHSRGGWVSLDVGMEPSKAIPQKILQISRQRGYSARQPGRSGCAHRHARSFRSVCRVAQSRRSRSGAEGRQAWLFGQPKCQPMLVPSFSVRSVDSTGAGDAFVAAFLQARLRGWPTIEGAIAANAAGALAATVVGAGQNLPGQREVAALLRAQRLRGKWDEARKRVLARLHHSPLAAQKELKMTRTPTTLHFPNGKRNRSPANEIARRSLSLRPSL